MKNHDLSAAVTCPRRTGWSCRPRSCTARSSPRVSMPFRCVCRSWRVPRLVLHPPRAASSRRHRRPHPAVEFRRRRRQRKQAENTQADRVRTGIVRTSSDQDPHPAMIWAPKSVSRSRHPAGCSPCCYYAEKPYKLHYACVPCRIAFKQHPKPGEHLCPRCSEPMVCAATTSRRRDSKAWTVVAAVLNAGLRYEGREPCGCGKEPKFRPRTRAQLRARRIAAARTGTPVADMLGRADLLAPG